MSYYKLSDPLLLAVLSVCFLSSTCAQNSQTKEDSVRKFCILPEVNDAACTGSITMKAARLQQNYKNCKGDLKAKYRTADGSCNNLLNHGQAGTPPIRLLNNSYDDGTDKPRTKGVDGRPLPSPTNVSRTVHTDRDINQRFTIMLMQWGQFIDHDITGFPISSEVDNTIRCCGENGRVLPEDELDSDCFPIYLTYEDADKRFVGKCMPFARSVAARDEHGKKLPIRNQINAVSSFIDASMVYGSSQDLQDDLREKVNGKLGFLLRTSPGEFLPFREDQENCEEHPEECFLAGDTRVNEQLGLTAIHTLFLRLHNLIARGLDLEIQHDNPAHRDEEIFQLARKIVGAIVQHIHFDEWLPLIIGRPSARDKDLLPQPRDGRTQYDSAENPQISNVFSTAAFRLGHTLIPEGYELSGEFVHLRRLFNKPGLIFKHRLSGVLQALIGTLREQGSHTLDRFFVTEITGHLFEPNDVGDGNPSHGLDLVALNIQRGRDHGLPPYNEYRELCGLERLKSFDDLPANERITDPVRRQRERERRIRDFRDVYHSVDDIDAFSGMIAEPPVARGSIVGPTLSCLLVKQFRALKFGDRFHYETDSTPEHFTDEQLQAIRKITLAHVLCQSITATTIQRKAFEIDGPRNNNTMVNCSDLRREFLNYRLFANLP